MLAALLVLFASTVAFLLAYCAVDVWRMRRLPFELTRLEPIEAAALLEAELRRRGLALSGSRVLLLGLTGRQWAFGDAEAPYDLMELLEQLGARVAYSDPDVHAVPHMSYCRNLDVRSLPLTESALKEQDAVLITARRRDVDYDWVNRHSSLVIDARGQVVCHG